jgi:hypothetical protein
MASELTPSATPVPAAPAPVVDLSSQPYFYQNEDGSFGGMGATKPWSIPGTPEYEITNTSDLHRANDWVFQSVRNTKAYTSSFESSENLALFGTFKAPKTAEEREAAGWRIIKHDRPASEHNAGIVYDRLSKFADEQKKIDRLNGVAFPSVYGLDPDEGDDQIMRFVADPNNNIPESIVKELLKETRDEGYYNERRRFGIDIKGKIKRQLLRLDDRYTAGEQAFQGGSTYLRSLTEQAQISTFLDIAYYKSKQKGGNFVNDAVHAGFNFIQDGVTAVVGAVDAMLPTAPDEYLSDIYRQDPVKRKKAEEVVRNAVMVLQKPIADLDRAQRSGNGSEVMAILNHYTDFDSPDNQEVIKAMTEMAALRADSAFRPGKTGEKLASFGAGVIEGIPMFKQFVGDSLDPGSVLFLGEHSFDRTGFIGSPFAIPLTVISKFQDNVKFWDESSDEDVLKAARTWASNWDNVNTKTGNAVSSAFEAIGLKEAANIARTAYGDERLKDAATATIDPITLGMGVTSLAIKASGRSAMAFAKFAEVSTAGKALAAEGEALATEIRAASQKGALEVGASSGLEEFRLNRIRDAFEKQTGRKISEAEALAVILSGKADDIIKTANETGDFLRKSIIDSLDSPEFADLAKRVRDFQAKATAHADNIKGVDKTTRPVSGTFISMFGGATEKTGRGIRKIGEYMATGGEGRIIGKKGLNFLLNNQKLPWVQGIVGAGAVVGGGYYVASEGGEWYQGALAGTFGLGLMLRPGPLMSSGKALETFGRVTKRVGQAAVTGEKVSGSPMRAAIEGLRKEASAIPNTLENAGRRTAIAEELRMMSWMRNSGWEDAARAGFHVVVDDVVHGGTMGAAFAWANDRSTYARGFGIGAAYGTSLRALSRITEIGSVPTAQETRSKQVIGELIAIDQGLDAHQSMRLREWLGGAKDHDTFIERADSYRRAHMATNGRIHLTNPAEMAAMSVAIHHSPDLVNKIKEEANVIHGNDPTAAAMYAEQRLADLQTQQQSKVNLDALSIDLADSSRRIDTISGEIVKIQERIHTEEANIKRNGQKTSKTLVELQHEMVTKETALKVTMAENLQIKSQHSEAQRQVESPLSFRRFEERTTPNGTLRQVKEGMYVHSGKNSHSIYFDVTKGDPFAMFHEAWEAMLADDAVRPMSGELTAILWGGEGKGQRISDQARDVFFTTYSNNLTAAEKTAFDASLTAAKKHYADTGSTALLDRYTREALAWWMATIDVEGRPAVYGGAGQPKVNVGVRGGSMLDSMMRLTRGDRRLMDILSNDNIRSEVNMLLDPEIGILPRRFASNAVQNLQSSGMRFIQGSNGTIRGFWLNSRNEVVRDPVVSKLYESILRMTGGEGSPRLQDLSTTQLTAQQQANLFIASGLTWLVDPATGTPIPGISQPAIPVPPPAPPKPTPTKPTAPAGQGQPVPTPSPTGRPAPAPTGQPTPTGGTTTPPPGPTVTQTIPTGGAPAAPPTGATHNGQPVGQGQPAPTGGATPPPTGGATPPTGATHNGQPTGQGQPAPTTGTPPPLPTAPTIPPPPAIPIVPTINGRPITGPTPATPPPTPPATPPVDMWTPSKPTRQANPSTMPTVGEVSGAHADMITRTLMSVPENQRGFQWSVDQGRPGKPRVLWGLPTESEVMAIEGLRGKMPDTIVDNLVKVMQSLQSAGGERPVFQGRYVRIQSHRTSATTEKRRLIGSEYQFVGDETFVPLHVESTTRYWSNDGESVISAREYEGLRPTEQGQYSPREGFLLNVFNLGKFNENLSKARSEGLRIYDKEGNVTGYVKDLAGNEITAKRFNELFMDNTEFHTLANQWMSRYLEGGPIDPTSVGVPGGKITEPSPAMLGNGDLALGEARLTALRATFGMTVRNGRTTVMPTNFTNQATRGMNFPFHNIDPTFLGPLQDTGARSLMAQPVVTRGQFNMSPAAWDRISSERVAQLQAGFQKVNPSANLTGSWQHPSLPNTFIHEFNGKAYDIYVEGQNVSNTARTFDEAVAQSNQVRLIAEAELDASRFADKLLREEATRAAREEARANAQAGAQAKKDANAQAKLEKARNQARTKAEQDLINEVGRGNAEWLEMAELIANREAQILQEHADAQAKGEKAHRDAVDATRAELDRIQNERAIINRKLQEDIIQRSAEKAAKERAAELTRQAAERRANAEAETRNIARNKKVEREARERADALREDIIKRFKEKSTIAERENIERVREVEREAQERADALRDDILRRDAEAQQAESERLNKEINRTLNEANKEAQRKADQAAKDAQREAERIAKETQKARDDAAKEASKQMDVRIEDAEALADALNSKDPEIDLAKVINASVRVEPSGLPVIAVNAPLIVRRIGGGKPFVPRAAVAGTQSGPAVTGAEGNARAAAILGSPEAGQAAAQVNRYFERHMGLGIDVQNAIGNVWKTELGNQLVAYYNGLNNKGKKVYTYHIYGINGAELYRTNNSRDAYNALRMNEDRLRNPTKNVPSKGISQEAVKSEFYRSLPGGGSIIEQQMTKSERDAQERAANRYK